MLYRVCPMAIVPTQRIELRVGHVGDQSHAPDAASRAVLVDGHDACRLLATVLQRVEPELRERYRLGLTPNTEYAAHDDLDLRVGGERNVLRRRARGDMMLGMASWYASASGATEL